MLDFLPPEERENFSPLLKREGGAFLLAQLAEVTDKIDHIQTQMRMEYADLADAPEGDRETLRILVQERNILIELAEELRNEPRRLLLDVVSHRLERDHTRIRELTPTFKSPNHNHAAYWQVETEMTILNTLMSKWLDQIRVLHDPKDDSSK